MACSNTVHFMYPVDRFAAPFAAVLPTLMQAQKKSLPADLWNIIQSFCLRDPATTLHSLASSCRQARQIVVTGDFWDRLCLLRTPREFAPFRPLIEAQADLRVRRMLYHKLCVQRENGHEPWEECNAHDEKDKVVLLLNANEEYGLPGGACFSTRGPHGERGLFIDFGSLRDGGSH
jgi:hypothetical protein